MTRKRKLYLVTFADTRDMRIELKARTAAEAIRTAERLYIDGSADDPRFESYSGDAFHDADAEEVGS